MSVGQSARSFNTIYLGGKCLTPGEPLRPPNLETRLPALLPRNNLIHESSFKQIQKQNLQLLFERGEEFAFECPISVVLTSDSNVSLFLKWPPFTAIRSAIHHAAALIILQPFIKVSVASRDYFCNYEFGVYRIVL